MKVSPTFLSLLLTALPFALAHPSSNVVKPRRTKSLLISTSRNLALSNMYSQNLGPPGIPDLPSASEAKTASASAGLNLDNIQGDVMSVLYHSSNLFSYSLLVSE